MTDVTNPAVDEATDESAGESAAHLGSAARVLRRDDSSAVLRRTTR